MGYLKVLFRVSRPAFWPIGPLVLLAGLFYSKGIVSLFPIIQMLLLTFPGGLVAYGINDIYDYDSDKINKRKKSFFGSVLNPRHNKLIFFAAFISTFLLIISSILTRNRLNIFSMVSLILCLFLYSVKPLRLKERPPLDSLCNGVIVLSTFSLGYSFGNAVFPLNKEIMLLTLCVSGIHAYTTLVDYSPDKLSNTKTFAVVYGKRAAAFFPMVVFLITLFIADFRWPIRSFIFFCALLFGFSTILNSEKYSRIVSKLIFLGFLVFSSLYLAVLHNYI